MTTEAGTHTRPKQWWAPVWKGLVVDAEAKHCRKMKTAVWLYLYFLLNAKRGTGVLRRKIKTVSQDMGVSRDTVVRWLNTLRRHGYVATLNNGRCLTVQVKNWKPLKSAQTRQQKGGLSDTGSWIHAAPHPSQRSPIADYSGRKPPVSAPPKERMINKLLDNETHAAQYATAHGPAERAFKPIGSCAHQTLLAWELARAFDDPAGINVYRSYCRQYPEEIVRKALAEVREATPTTTKQGRIALFTHLLLHYAKGTTEDSGG
jgi:hypothetical protein